jgi:type IV pilus assembly protein PilW
MKTAAQLMPCERQRGFSLVELMIAMTIGFIVLAGIGYLYVESRQAFRSMDNLSRMQESARYALEIIARDIRMAGYRGCASSSGDFHNTLSKGTESAYNFGLPINGYDGGAGSWTPALPADTGGLSGLSILAETDAIILRSATGSGATVSKQPGNSSADLQITTPNDLAINDIVMVTNCKAATVFQVTNMNVNGTGQNVVHNTGTSAPGNSTKDLVENYSASGGEIIKMQSKSYFIRTGASGRPALWQFDNYKPAGGDNPAEIAEGVENMQILYGIDANADGVVESYSAADAVANWSLVAAVRISLLMAGNDDNVATSKQKYNYNGALVDAPDRRLRQVFTTTVSVRNRTQ